MKKQLFKLIAIVAVVVIGSCSMQVSAQWAANGTHINNTNTGNVGIGTGVLVPPAKLTVQASGSVPSANWVSAGTPIFNGFGEQAVGNADYILSMASSFFNARPVFIGRRAKGTLAAPLVVANNDFLSSFLVSGYDGANFQNPAAIDFYVDGVPAAGSVPARISFVTGSNSATRAERLRILSGGDVTVTTGNLGINTGNINVTLGNMNVAAGNINVAGGNINMGSSTKTIQFATPATGNVGMMNMFPSNTQNMDRMVLQHSPAFPNWGLQYQDTADRFNFIAGGSPVLTADLGAGRVGIGTIAPTLGKLEVQGTVGSIVAAFRNSAGNGMSLSAANPSMYFNSYFNGTQKAMVNGFTGHISFNESTGKITMGSSTAAGTANNTTASVNSFAITNNGNVGIGTVTPTAQLHVVNNSVNQALSIISSTANGQIANIQTTTALNAGNDLLQLDLPTGQGADAQFIEASINNSSRFAVNSDGRVGIGGSALTGVGVYVQTGTDAALGSGGYVVTGLTSGPNISIDNNEIMARDNGATSRLYLQNSGGDLSMCVSSGAVSIGTNTIANGYKLNVNGRIIGTEVRVDALANWPDYVFSPNHKLLPLEELEASINANKHLPGIPSASEVKEKGIMLGDMQTKTMEKVEELTLYLIQLSKENKELKARLEKLENK